MSQHRRYSASPGRLLLPRVFHEETPVEGIEEAPEPTAEGLDADMDSYWSAKGAADAEPAAEEPAAEEPAAEVEA